MPATISSEEAELWPKRYPEEFRREVLDLVASGRPVAQVAADLDTSAQRSTPGARRS